MFQPNIHSTSCQGEKKSREGASRRLTWERINSDCRLLARAVVGEINAIELSMFVQLLGLETATAKHMLFPRWVGPCELVMVSGLHFVIQV